MSNFKPIKIRDQNLISFKVYDDWKTEFNLDSIDEDKDVAIVFLSQGESLPDPKVIRKNFDPFLSVLFGYKGEKPLQRLVNSIDENGLVNVDLADLKNLIEGGFGFIRYKSCSELIDSSRWDRGMLDIFVNRKLTIVELEKIIGDFLDLREFIWGLKVNNVENPKALSIMIKDWGSGDFLS